MTCLLDRTVREWRLLEVVHPIFAIRSWKLSDSRCGDAATITYEADAQKAAEINIKTATEFFFNDMDTMDRYLRQLSGRKLSPRSFQRCVDAITDLLFFLEDLVDDDILGYPLAQDSTYPSQGQHEACTIDDQAPIQTSPDHESWVSRLMSWIPDMSSRPDDLEQPVSQLLQGQSTISTVEEEPQTRTFGKLEAMAGIIAQSRDDDDNARKVDCRKYIKLEHSLEVFTCGTRLSYTVIACIEGIMTDLMGRDSFQPPAQHKVAETRWQDQKPGKLSNQLFAILQKRICDEANHEAILQLAGFELDECCNSSLTLNMFLSSHESWREFQCSSVTRGSRESVLISDLCPPRQKRKVAARSKVHFDDKDLSYLRNTNDYHFGAYGDAPPMVSLQDLIEGGYLRDRDDDDDASFNRNDKAVLALSLARCLLHLWQTSWLKEPWKAGSIQFVNHQDQIKDIHRPYIACSLDSRTSTTAATPSHSEFQVTLLAFARLLLEIETGEVIPVETEVPSEIEDAISCVLEQRKNKYGRGDYNLAVAGYRHVKALMRRQEGDPPSGSDDDTSHMNRLRKALYEAIIQYLENNFNQIQDHKRAMDFRILDLGRQTISSTSSGASHAEWESRRSASVETSRSRTGRSRSEATASGSTLPIPPSTIFFDGQPCDTNNNRADKFFTLFDEFRERHISPKIDAGCKSPGWRRIKVAILDTGIYTKNGDIRSVCDIIKGIRRHQDKSNPIKELRSFTGIPGDRGVDSCGHGTHVAWLVLKTAPDVDLYIAKIADDEHSASPKAISQAIRWAMNDVNADLVTMSFGSNSIDRDIEEAIHQARDTKPNQTILLAAASNSGLNRERTFPASDSCVIGVHSLDGFGNNSGGLNPPAMENRDNLGTLGLGIKMLWKGVEESRSGSSYATPIAAGLAANMLLWLDYMSVHRRDEMRGETYTSLRTINGMRHMLRKMSGAPDGANLRYVAPWHLFKDHSTPDYDRRVSILFEHDLKPVKI